MRVSRFGSKTFVVAILAIAISAGAAVARTQEPAATLLSVRSMAINSATGKFYAAEPSHGTVAVFNPTTHATAHVNTGDEPLALAINTKTNRIYVVNHGGGTLTIIDGAADSVLQTIDVGALPYVVAVNETTNRVYISNVFSDVVTVIDGATNAVQKIKAGSADTITLDQQRDRIFLAGYQSTKLVTLNKTPEITGDVKVGYHAWGTAVDESTGTLYVTRVQDSALLIIDESSGATTATIPVGYIPCAVALNPVKNRAYVVNHGSDTVTVIDTSKRTVVATVKVGSSPQGVAVDSTSNRVYVANSHSSSISVIDGASNEVLETITTNRTGNSSTKPYNVLVDSSTRAHSPRIYVALEGDDSWTMLETITVTQNNVKNENSRGK
jgi:YVTN family beta-propeller protein